MKRSRCMCSSLICRLFGPWEFSHSHRNRSVECAHDLRWPHRRITRSLVERESERENKTWTNHPIEETQKTDSNLNDIEKYLSLSRPKWVLKWVDFVYTRAWMCVQEECVREREWKRIDVRPLHESSTWSFYEKKKNTQIRRRSDCEETHTPHT